MKIVRVFGVLVWVGVLGVCFGEGGEEGVKRPSVVELLKKYAENQDKLVSLIAKTESSIVGSELYDRKIREDVVKYSAGELRFDGNRASSRYHMWGQIGPKDSYTKDEALYQSRLWDGRDYYQYDLAIHLSPSAKGKVVLSQGNEEANKVYDRSTMTVRNHSCGPLMGLFRFDAERVDKIVSHAEDISVRKEMEKVNGSNCYVIDAKTKRGKYILWIDPEHDYNIAQAENVKQAGDLAFSTDSLLSGKAKISYSIRDIQFKKVDGIWVPVDANIETSRTLQDGRFFYASKLNVKINDIVLNPDHDALNSFVPSDIKNGATVYLKGANAIAYTWRDGKVVDGEGKEVKVIIK